MLKITEQAETAFKQIADEKGSADPIFQIVIMGFGWGGPSVGLVQAEENNPDLINQDIQGVMVVWDHKVEQMTRYYGNLVIDYVKFFSKGRFVVTFDRASSC